MGRGRLKPGWTRVAFGDIAVSVNDRIDNPLDAGVERYVGLEHLDSDSLAIRRWAPPSAVTATKLLFRRGDIIFGRRRVYQRKLAVADFDGICSAHALVLRAKPKVVLPEFLPFFMQSDSFMRRAEAISVGSLSPTINWRTLASKEFALPPLNEQRRMANLLRATSALFARISDISDAANTIRKIIYNRYFWETDNTALKTTIGEVAVVRNGTTPKRSNSDYWNGDLPWLPSAKVNDVYITRADEHITQRALSKCSLTIIPAESTLVAMIGQGATRGRAALLQMEATINQNLAAVTPSADVHPRFLFYQLDAQYRALRYWSQGSNQHALNCQLIADFPIWVPAMPTQVAIARQLDRCVDASRASSERAAKVRILQKNTIESLLG